VLCVRTVLVSLGSVLLGCVFARGCGGMGDVGGFFRWVRSRQCGLSIFEAIARFGGGFPGGWGCGSDVGVVVDGGVGLVR